MVEVAGLDRAKAKAVRPLRALARFPAPYRLTGLGARSSRWW